MISIDKINKFSQISNSKLSYWKSAKKKGSKGEQYTREFLKKHSILYKEQFIFNDLFYKNPNSPLRFDFKIWYKDFTFLLEIDGGQHSKCVNFGGKLTEDEMQIQLRENKERDSLKNQYCENHNIILKRIPWDGNKLKLEENLKKLFLSFNQKSF